MHRVTKRKESREKERMCKCSRALRVFVCAREHSFRIKRKKGEVSGGVDRCSGSPTVKHNYILLLLGLSKRLCSARL